MESQHRQLGTLLNEQRLRLAETIVARQYALQPGVWERYGEEGRKLSVRDQAYHLQFLAEAILARDTSLFTEYITWTRELFAGIKLPESGLRVTLECTRDVLRAHLPPELAAITNEYTAAGLYILQQPVARTPEFLPASDPLGDLARQYIDTLLRGDRRQASQFVLESVEQGTAVKDIYLQVFQRAQYEIGRLWMTNKISVAQEHFCTAATQLIMSQLYPLIFSTERVGRCLVAACVGGELHEIGVRMVADFFEMEGWDTYYLGANAPARTILQALQDRQPHVLGISATMTFHLRLVEDLITSVRSADLNRPIKILVGGYPFTKHPQLWKQMGADGFAVDAQGAVAVAHDLVTE